MSCRYFSDAFVLWLVQFLQVLSKHICNSDSSIRESQATQQPPALTDEVINQLMINDWLNPDISDVRRAPPSELGLSNTTFNIGSTNHAWPSLKPELHLWIFTVNDNDHWRQLTLNYSSVTHCRDSSRVLLETESPSTDKLHFITKT